MRTRCCSYTLWFRLIAWAICTYDSLCSFKHLSCSLCLHLWNLQWLLKLMISIIPSSFLFKSLANNRKFKSFIENHQDRKLKSDHFKQFPTIRNCLHIYCVLVLYWKLHSTVLVLNKWPNHSTVKYCWLALRASQDSSSQPHTLWGGKQQQLPILHTHILPSVLGLLC